MIRHDTHLHIGSLLFEGIDQIDLAGPFEVLSRVPNSSYRIYGKPSAGSRKGCGLRPTLPWPMRRRWTSCRPKFLTYGRGVIRSLLRMATRWWLTDEAIE